MGLSKQALYDRYKKMYDPMYTFSLCREDEIDGVIDFIDTYWKKGHALVKSRELMDWQYHNPINHVYHFVIARSKETGDIHAIEGFIPTSQFDPEIKNAMTWGAIWKTIPEVAPPGLGFVLKQYREHEFETKYSCEIGISEDAGKYNKQFGNTIFALENWYIVNPNKNSFALIETSPCYKREKNQNRGCIKFKKITPLEWNKASKSLPIPEFKSGTYYVNRYFKHPIYQYFSILLEDESKENREVVFYRIAEHEGSRCVFFVDYLGDGTLLSKSYDVLVDIMQEYDAEYILFPCYGLAPTFLEKAGFNNTRHTREVIPLYYEPFLKQSIDIICASKSPSINWCNYKGDADQDRPNIIRGFE